MMGLNLDGLGNHNFDKGQAYLRNTLIPLANFPYVSSNVVDANGTHLPNGSPRLSLTRSTAARSVSSDLRTKMRRSWSSLMHSIHSTSNHVLHASKLKSIACAVKVSRRSLQ